MGPNGRYHMLLEAILKHSQRAGLVEEANALEQVRFKTTNDITLNFIKKNIKLMHFRRQFQVI